MCVLLLPLLTVTILDCCCGGLVQLLKVAECHPDFANIECICAAAWGVCDVLPVVCVVCVMCVYRVWPRS